MNFPLYGLQACSERLRTDEAFRESCARNGQTADSLAEFLRAEGFSVVADDLKAVLAAARGEAQRGQGGPLSESQLAGLSGGGFFGDLV